MANSKDLIQPNKDATEVYDQKHGSYSDQQGKNVSTGAGPLNPSPLANLHNPDVKSQKQAGLMGVIAGGGTPRTPGAGGISQSSAKKSLRGLSVKGLPESK